MKKNIEKKSLHLIQWAGMFVLAFVFSLALTAQPGHASSSYVATVAKGYLALRNAPEYDSSNEIGRIYSGEELEVMDSSGSTYWVVYSNSVERVGYVNKNYLASSDDTATVSVKKGYLALRTAKAYDESNEKGELYTGYTVQIANRLDDTYWLVYSPDLGKGGYVNKNYLVTSSSSSETTTVTKTVKVKKGYLALRTAKAYDESNEIGELYTGDTVQVKDTSDSTYWYVYAPSLGKSGYVNKNYLY